MAPLQRISPCLWFDSQAEEAARAYTAIFPRSRITTVTRYGEAGQEIHGRAPGSVMVVAFELDGISLQVHCDTQAEIDHYWAQLGAGGDPRAQQCGWLKDRFGLSWQIVPRQIEAWLSDPDSRRADRVMAAVLQMKKLDLAAIEHAFSGA